MVSLAGFTCWGFSYGQWCRILINLHAGMNLYNNGFSGGFTAALLVPIF